MILKAVHYSVGIMLRYFITHALIHVLCERSDLDKKTEKTASGQYL